MLRKKALRSGYTTGACAAAAAKAATLLVMRKALCTMSNDNSLITDVEIPFPDGGRVRFAIHDSGSGSDGPSAWASVIKDAGDDPDVTNGAEIVATATFLHGPEKRRVLLNAPSLLIKGGKGVGTVTKPGLSVAVGEPAINPVPKRMIEAAIKEALSEVSGFPGFRASALDIEVTISVPKGEKLAKKTLNERLGIIGGISILGTTGIVRPVSSEAWTATITASMDVAKASGSEIVVLSAGRASERAHMRKYHLPDEAYVMMGDYLEYSLLEAKKHDFKQVHLAAQWAKMIKIAMATPQTHVRHGALEIKKALAFLAKMDTGLSRAAKEFNTARDIFDFVSSSPSKHKSEIFAGVCAAAQRYSEGITGGIPVTTCLVSYEGAIIGSSE
ncbi:MAG: cobalt-precorrin-5B (C(1))-methyltransferase CbiD [Nitrospirota bacterium]